MSQCLEETYNIFFFFKKIRETKKTAAIYYTENYKFQFQLQLLKEQGNKARKKKQSHTIFFFEVFLYAYVYICQETAMTSTQQPNSVADPLVDEYICEVCGKKFKREQTRDLHMRGHNLPFTVPRRRN